MKTNTITFNSNRSLNDISDRLRDISSQLRANADYSIDPFAHSIPNIAVHLSGRKSVFSSAFWGVSVYVRDKETHREIELQALGDHVGAKVLSGFDRYNGLPSGFYHMNYSLKKRDKIKDYLK